MPLLQSLKTRLIVMAALWILVGIISAGFVLSAVFRHHVTAQFKEELYVHLSELERLADLKDGKAVLTRPLSDPRYDEVLSGFYWEIQRGDAVLARSASMQGPMLRTPIDEPKDVGVHTHLTDGPTGPILVAEQGRWQTPSGPVVRFIIGTDQRHLDTVLGEFNRTLAISLATFAGALILAAGLLIAFALRPLDQLREALGYVRNGQRKQISDPFPSEVQPLVDDLNGLLASTGDLVQRARTQAGNIAHGLKTPLAILSDEAHRLERDGLSKPAATIVAQVKKMQTHIDYQITRARAAAAHITLGNSASLSIAADEVTMALQRLYRAREIRVKTTLDPALRVACDRQDLNEILANLLDNAFKHASSKVEVSAGPAKAGNRVAILIDDDGSGLPAEAREIVFNVGERWDSQEPGSGLGLAIARDLARLYGGDVHLAESPLGGLRVELVMAKVSSA
jgi:signal transduction histidine kinase